MLTIIRNARTLGQGGETVQDIAMAGGKIIAMAPKIDMGNLPAETFDAGGRVAVPGFIDIHVHTSGGGGQTGFTSLAPEIKVKKLLACGTTTVVGTLGTDGFVKQLPQLYAKTMSLRENGLSAYMYTGFYGLPTPTLTGSVAEDLIYIDPVVGCKIAVGDDRSSFPSDKDLLKIINNVRLGGFTSGKHGIMHVHLGPLPEGMEPLIRIARKYPSLISYISPTHTARCESLFRQAVDFALTGGMIDISTGGTRFKPCHLAVLDAMEKGVAIDNMTFSSDGYGGVMRTDPVTGKQNYTFAPLHTNLEEVVRLITEDGVAPAEAFKLITANPARLLNFKSKGRLAPGYDADVCLMNEDWSIDSVFARGRHVLKDGEMTYGINFED